MSRHFSSFLESYAEYAQEQFCPPKFHFWTGIALISAALERRVWVNQVTHKTFPNLFILLVSKPGIGKTTAGDVGIPLLYQLQDPQNGGIKFLSRQSTEPAFYKQFEDEAGNREISKKFSVGNVAYTHSSCFLYAPEASNSLKDMVNGGKITDALTEFYDCPAHWSKTLATVQKTVEIENLSVSMLACTTFSYLSKLIPRSDVAGGFASRLTYVVQHDKVERRPKFMGEKRKLEVERYLAEDLNQIYRLTGPFTTSNDFGIAFEDWFYKQDQERQALPSERVQNFLARRHTTVLKLAMVLCVSESSAMRLEVRHFEEALHHVTELEADLPHIIGQSLDPNKPEGITYTVLLAIQECGNNASWNELINKLVHKGVDFRNIPAALQMLTDAGAVARGSAEIGGSSVVSYRLLVDPKTYL